MKCDAEGERRGEVVIVYDSILDLEDSGVPQKMIWMEGNERGMIRDHSIVIWKIVIGNVV